MVNIVSFDRLKQAPESVKANTNTSDTFASPSKFSDTLKTATTQANEKPALEKQTPQVENGTGKVEANEKPAEKDKSVEKDKSTLPYTLEFLLPTQKVDDQQEVADAQINIAELMNVTSLNDLIKLIGGKLEGDSNTGESLSLSKIASALSLKEKDVEQLLTKLLGEKSPKDLWQALQKVDDKLAAVLSKIASTINGAQNAQLSKKEAQSAVALLKFIELAAPKTDLLLKQELQVSQVKNWLSTLAGAITEKTTEKEVTLPFATKLFQMKSVQPVSEQSQSVQNAQGTAANAILQKPTAITMTLPAAPQQVQAGKFVEEFQSIMSRMQVANNTAGTRLLIKLYPENLGTIRVEFVQKDGVLSARLLASTALGKQMLEGSLSSLKQGFVSQNVQVDRIDITQALSDASKGEQSRGHQFGQQQQSSNNQQHPDDQKNSTTEKELTFEELLARMEE